MARALDNFSATESQASAVATAGVKSRSHIGPAGGSCFSYLGAGCNRILHFFYPPGVLHHSGGPCSGFARGGLVDKRSCVSGERIKGKQDFIVGAGCDLGGGFDSGDCATVLIEAIGAWRRPRRFIAKKSAGL